MKTIIIDGIRYDVISNTKIFYNNYEELINYNIAYDNGTYTIPIKCIDPPKKKPYYKLFNNPELLILLNKEYLTEEYLSSNIVDFENIDSINDYINKIEHLKKINVDNIKKFNISSVEFPIKNEDDIELKLLKDAINSKSFDIHSYKHRFGNTFSNVLRELKTSNKISINRLKDIAQALDLEIEIIIRDSKKSINPINKEIKGIITNERNDI